MKKTKVIGTIKTDIKIESLKQFIENGVNAIHIPWDAATEEFLDTIVSKVNQLNKKFKQNVPVILDVMGPRIFTGSFDGGSALFTTGDKIRVYMDSILGDSTKFSVSYHSLLEDIRINTTMKVGEELVEFRVIEKGIDYLLCEVTSGGKITNHSLVTVLDTTLELPFISSQDKHMIGYASKLGIDYLSLSMVHSSEDVLCINDLLISLKNDTTGILVKMDNEKAIDDMDEIMKVCDGIIVSRSDLGIELPMERIPAIQKTIIHKCHMLGKVSIVSLELASSINVKPNRAEVSDIASAVLESCDALLLDITLFSQYMLEAVSMLGKIIESSETDVNYYELLDRSMRTEVQDTTGWIAYSVTECAARLKTKAIVAPTMSGYTAKKISRFRPMCPIVAMTPDAAIAKSLSIYYGVYPVVEKDIKSFDAMMNTSKEIVKSLELGFSCDKFIITGGYPFKNVKHTNFMKIEEV